jgi:hypothetical protein
LGIQERQKLLIGWLAGAEAAEQAALQEVFLA